MLIAYILNKDRSLSVKLVRSKNNGIFTYNGHEYTVDTGRIYQKKALFVKSFFWSMYMEGNPNPIEFTETGFNVDSGHVSLDEISYLLRKIRKTKQELIFMLVLAGSFLMNLLVLLRVMELG